MLHHPHMHPSYPHPPQLPQGNGFVSCVLNLTNVGGSVHGNEQWEGFTEIRCLVAVDVHDFMAAPEKRTCRSMPLCFKINFVPLPSVNGLALEFGAPQVQVVPSPAPYVDTLLNISWKYLDVNRSTRLESVTIEYLQEDSSVPHTLPGLIWPYSSFEALIPLSAIRATIPVELEATGIRIRFRVNAWSKWQNARDSKIQVFGPWSEWAVVWSTGVEPWLMDTGIAYAVSWNSNLVSLWQLRRAHAPFNESGEAPNKTQYEAVNIRKYASGAFSQGSIALDSLLHHLFLIVSNPDDSSQHGHQLLVVEIPGGDVIRQLDLTNGNSIEWYRPGSIWNVQYDEFSGALIAASNAAAEPVSQEVHPESCGNDVAKSTR